MSFRTELTNKLLNNRQVQGCACTFVDQLPTPTNSNQYPYVVIMEPNESGDFLIDIIDDLEDATKQFLSLCQRRQRLTVTAITVAMANTHDYMIRDNQDPLTRYNREYHTEVRKEGNHTIVSLLYNANKPKNTFYYV